MTILLILPNWLGDAVMATPAIEILSHKYPNAEFTLLGSYVSIEALKYHPQVKNALIDTTKQEPNRLIATHKLAKQLGAFHLAINFRDNLFSSLLLYMTNTVVTCARSSWHSRFLLSHTSKIPTNIHLVQQYAKIASLNITEKIQETPPLKLYIPAIKKEKKTLGINAGATYGSAKRWLPQRFAQVASAFANTYDILIFGGPNEVETAKEIEENLLQLGVKNFTNLAGKTDIKELCESIGSCDVFVTNDSGPMHVAAAYGVPSVAIFGPTKHKETSQWRNKNSHIIHKEMECSPCMKRECPLKHHECMQKITAQDVINAMATII